MTVRQAKKVDNRSLDDLFGEEKALVQTNVYYPSGKLKSQNTKQAQQESVFLWSYNTHLSRCPYRQCELQSSFASYGRSSRNRSLGNAAIRLRTWS